ncbi:hypothetical protein H2200_006335 [Cladophialophora chaetospira]|uniref:Uncharacterized protein n=1 Tax=Cladophialophora chaetospira TaxID=386627 RepID=A0AA39CJ67_9EURO|nr:hypothetical protein H2200_006335 [Cladophialophora chaetospira]
MQTSFSTPPKGSATFEVSDSVPMGDSGLPLRTLWYFRTQIKPKDWQIERYVLRIHFNPAVAQALSRLAEYHAPIFEEPDAWVPHVCGCLIHELESIRDFSGRKGIELAMSSLSKRQMCFKRCLDVDGEEQHFGSQTFRPGHLGQLSQRDFQTLRAAIASRRGFEAYTVEHQEIFKAPFEVAEPGTADVEMDRQNPRVEQSRLIKKPSHWPRETPELCLFALGEHIDFNDNLQLSQLIQDTTEIFGTRGKIQGRDKSILRRWSQALREDVTAETRFERELVIAD